MQRTNCNVGAPQCTRPAKAAISDPDLATPGLATSQFGVVQDENDCEVKLSARVGRVSLSMGCKGFLKVLLVLYFEFNLYFVFVIKKCIVEIDFVVMKENFVGYCSF